MFSRDILTGPCMCHVPKTLDHTFPTIHLHRTEHHQGCFFGGVFLADTVN